MKLKLIRKWKKKDYTIGELYIDGIFFSNTIEDTDRGLKHSMSLSQIKKIKVMHKTAIPTGTYDVTLNVVSPKFSKKKWYFDNFNCGKLPRLLNVPGFEGILIHSGSDLDSTSGCIIVGENKIVGKVINSLKTLLKLYNILKKSKDNITIEIT